MMAPLGEESEHWKMAHLAFEYGIPPSVLLNESPRMLWTMERYLVWRVRQSENAKRKR